MFFLRELSFVSVPGYILIFIFVWLQLCPGNHVHHDFCQNPTPPPPPPPPPFPLSPPLCPFPLPPAAFFPSLREDDDEDSDPPPPRSVVSILESGSSPPSADWDCFSWPRRARTCNGKQNHISALFSCAETRGG